MISHIYLILDKRDSSIVQTRKNWCYQALGEAKTSAKKYIDSRNRRTLKPDKLKFDDFQIVRYELNPLEEYRI